MMRRREPRPRHRNAATVLPPRLLARVQRVLTGYVTIPPILTLAETRQRMLASLHRQGATRREMAAALQVSVRQVARLLRAQPPGHPAPPCAHPLPAPLLAQVQQYVTGWLYVPPATSAAARRWRQMQRAFQANLPTAAIARRLGCSARHVRRERARWRDAQARTALGITPPTPTPSSVPAPPAPRVWRCPICGHAEVPRPGARCAFCQMVPDAEPGDVVRVRVRPVPLD